MTKAHTCDISLAVTGSGGAGAITAGELLLELAGNNGCFGMMRRSFGPQIRGGEAAALLRIRHRPVECMNDRFDLLLALDWRNAERFADEIPLQPDALVIADPAVGKVPVEITELGVDVIPVPMKALADEIPGGRPNMVALGVLAHWLGLCPDEAARLIDHVFHGKGPDIVAGSRAAFERGFNEPLIVAAREARPRPGPSRAQPTPRWDLSGNEGCGLGALRGGVRFAAAYPITPSSDLLEWLAPRLAQLGGGLLQAEDELASINMVIGASFGGVPALTATSGPGFSLMAEGLGLAVAAEVPAVVVNVMRGGPSTGIPTKSEQSDLNIALYGLHGDAPHLVLGALDHGDCVLTTEWAVRLSEALQTVAVVLTDQYLAQSRALIPEPDYRLPEVPARATASDGEDGYLRYAATPSGVSPMAIPGTPGCTYVADGLEHDERGKPSTAAIDHANQLDKRRRKIEAFDYGELWADVRGEGETAILTWGSVAAAAREAAERSRATGREVKVIALRLLLPAQPERLAAELEGVTRLLVVEQSHGAQFLRYLRAHYDLPVRPRSLARPGPLPITPGEIVEQLEMEV